MEKAVMFLFSFAAFPENFSTSDFLSGRITRDFLEILFQFTRKSFQGELDGHRSCVCVCEGKISQFDIYAAGKI